LDVLQIATTLAPSVIVLPTIVLGIKFTRIQIPTISVEHLDRSPVLLVQRRRLRPIHRNTRSAVGIAVILRSVVRRLAEARLLVATGVLPVAVLDGRVVHTCYCQAIAKHDFTESSTLVVAA
jgi:hypothetical protein